MLEPLGVPAGDALTRGEQLLETGELGDPDRAEEVGQPVVEPGSGMSKSPRGTIPWWRKRRIASASSGSSVVTAPPSPVVTILRGWKERQPIAPSEPHGVSR